MADRRPNGLDLPVARDLRVPRPGFTQLETVIVRLRAMAAIAFISSSSRITCSLLLIS
jgi:hypothetical protein